jgi:hypothetical protein
MKKKKHLTKSQILQKYTDRFKFDGSHYGLGRATPHVLKAMTAYHRQQSARFKKEIEKLKQEIRNLKSWE